MLGWILLLSLLLMSVGCGGGGFINPGNAAQPSGLSNTTAAGSYVVQVTASQGAQSVNVASIPLQVSF